MTNCPSCGFNDDDEWDEIRAKVARLEGELKIYKEYAEKMGAILGTNEQPTRLFNTWECTNCGQFHPFTMGVCPTAGER